MNLHTCATENVVARQQHMQDPQPERRRGAQGAGGSARRQEGSRADRAIVILAQHIAIAARDAARATLTWLSDLPYDSRDRLHSKEYALAVLGVSWASDPVHDAALAHDIEVARQQRVANDVSRCDEVKARPGSSSPAAQRHNLVSISEDDPDLADVAVLV